MYFFPISKIEEQVIWEIYLDFGSLEGITKFSYLVKSESTFTCNLLSRDLFAFSYCNQ